ncbi:hypothetical protein R3P38DRAFT_3236557 [Favolaschia claudopus]|uniref:Uncharacterized protein n=1 Tax=Favolaschia claudopus TaxID=2862362 RepID=A0AAV9ZCW3_9AGAR
MRRGSPGIVEIRITFSFVFGVSLPFLFSSFGGDFLFCFHCSHTFYHHIRTSPPYPTNIDRTAGPYPSAALIHHHSSSSPPYRDSHSPLTFPPHPLLRLPSIKGSLRRAVAALVRVAGVGADSHLLPFTYLRRRRRHHPRSAPSSLPPRRLARSPPFPALTPDPSHAPPLSTPALNTTFTDAAIVALTW